MIIAVIGEKGGTGKTTFAVHLAGWRKISGRRVMLLDADRQGSSSMWVERRQEYQLAMPECEQRFDTGVRRAIVDFARRHDDVVVDIGAGDGHLIEQVLGIANAAVVPFQPNEMDIWTIDLLDDLVRRAREVNRALDGYGGAEPCAITPCLSRCAVSANGPRPVRRDRDV